VEEGQGFSKKYDRHLLMDFKSGGDFLENLQAKEATTILLLRRPCPARNSSISLRQGANEYLQKCLFNKRRI
jgi:hypothetical protein